MGASSSLLLRAVALAPMEGSCAARYAVISPTARSFVVEEAAGIRLLVLRGKAAGPDCVGEASLARELLVVGYEGSEEDITSRPRAAAYLRAEILPRLAAPRPRQVSILAADDEGSEEEIHPRARAYLLRPHQLAFVAADDVSEVEFLYRPPSYVLAPRPRALSLAAGRASASEILSHPRALFLLAAQSVGGEAYSRTLQIAAMRQRDLAGSTQMVPARSFSATATDRISYDTSLGARPRFHQPAIRTGYGSLGHLFRPAGRPDSLRSMVELPLIQFSRRRNIHSWCWTPWNPHKPKCPITSQKEFDDILKMLKDRKLTNEEKEKLKEFLLEKLYAEDEAPEAYEVKLDLILYGLKVNNKSLKSLKDLWENKPRKWKILNILVTWLSAVISIFK